MTSSIMDVPSRKGLEIIYQDLTEFLETNYINEGPLQDEIQSQIKEV